MKSKHIYLPLLTLIMLLFTSCNSEAQNKTSTTNLVSDAKIEVIQFHSQNRCMTCKKIEALTKKTLTGYESIPFSLVNVDDSKNEKMAEEFEAAGTALFLYNRASGKKTDLTNFAFMNAGNEDKFITGLANEIDLFLK